MMKQLITPSEAEWKRIYSAHPKELGFEALLCQVKIAVTTKESSSVIIVDPSTASRSNQNLDGFGVIYGWTRLSVSPTQHEGALSLSLSLSVASVPRMNEKTNHEEKGSYTTTTLAI